jgi:hypothetical protein
MYEELQESDNAIAGRPIWAGPAQQPTLVYTKPLVAPVPTVPARRHPQALDPVFVQILVAAFLVAIAVILRLYVVP